MQIDSQQAIHILHPGSAQRSLGVEHRSRVAAQARQHDGVLLEFETPQRRRGIDLQRAHIAQLRTVSAGQHQRASHAVRARPARLAQQILAVARAGVERQQPEGVDTH